MNCSLIICNTVEVNFIKLYGIMQDTEDTVINKT